MVTPDTTPGTSQDTPELNLSSLTEGETEENTTAIEQLNTCFVGPMIFAIKEPNPNKLYVVQRLGEIRNGIISALERHAASEIPLTSFTTSMANEEETAPLVIKALVSTGENGEPDLTKPFRQIESDILGTNVTTRYYQSNISGLFFRQQTPDGEESAFKRHSFYLVGQDHVPQPVQTALPAAPQT